MGTKLDQLYSLRDSFTIIGVTGRTGSGCTDLSNLLAKDFSKIENVRKPDGFQPSIFQRKYTIVYDYVSYSGNWKIYKVLEYKKILFLMLIPYLRKNPENTLLYDFYRNRLKDLPEEDKIKNLKKSIQDKIIENKTIVDKIVELGEISEIKDEDKLKNLNDIFWNDPDFLKLSTEIDSLLKSGGITERIMLLHHIASNFRKSGQPFKTDKKDLNNIYSIANVINRIIKATRQESGKKECHIVIDSLRNSLEINFFKERYSAFYLIAVKNDQRKTKLIKSYEGFSIKIIDRILEMDDIEYKNSDFQKGDFYAPDVQNCIQAADYHINNIQTEDIDSEKESFQSLGEQLMKLQGLIRQPGLITPDPSERIMQMAYTAKLNSHCISRQVGAVVTDEEFSVKAVGWNDVPKGAIPCSVRNIKEIGLEKPFGFTKFELGKGLKETEQIHIDADNELDNESKEFNQYVLENFNDDTLKPQDLGGRNCPYCFKQAYNSFTGEKNQVHTRSLHAEENAMMQISKYGGQGLKNGYLFTTASPCELCAKKAYQLGIRTIYYIDPYPGISRNHILKSNESTDPKLILFSGAVGKAYHKLYEPFMSQKDELTLLTDLKLKSPQKIKAKQLRSLIGDSLKGDKELMLQLDKKLENDEDVFDSLIGIIKKGLNG